jgi:hypothetical protein
MPTVRLRALLALTLAALTAALIPSAAGGSTVAELRVEGPDGALDAGTWYATGTEKLKRSKGLNCKPRSGHLKFPGANALGILDTAAGLSDGLAPARVRPDSFGPFVCEIGGVAGRPFDDPDGFSGWTYWVDFAGGTSSADLAQLDGGERVLWVFADFGSAATNSGNALELSGVPAYDADGTFTVTVVSHGFDGTPTPLEGAEITGATSVEDIGDGEYEVTVPTGTTELYAQHHPDIPSNRLEACVAAEASACPTAQGRTILGAARNDRLDGTEGPDTIRSRGGEDEIDISGGGSDRVNCGGDTDKVFLDVGDSNDDIAGNCEKVKRLAL